MAQMRFFRFVTLAASLVWCWANQTLRGDPVEDLRSTDIKVRRHAIDAIQTLDDARVPEACLPLLMDEGRSIRRQAARAIGSRFAKIPEERRSVFAQALRQSAEEGPEDTRLVVERALGLMTGRYDGAPFSSSPDGQWVLYERRRLPAILEVKSGRDQLLGFVVPEWFGSDTQIRGGDVIDTAKPARFLKLMVTNESAKDLFDPTWQPGAKAVAFTMRLQRRFFSPVLIWRASDRSARAWDVEAFRPLYGNRFPHWATVIEFQNWRGNLAVLRIHDVDSAGDSAPFDPIGIPVSVDINTWQIALEEDSAADKTRPALPAVR